MSLVLVGAVARADVFAPGELSEAHAHLKGLDNCTKCHPPGNKLSNEKCLACHEELAPAVDEDRGLHGRLPDEKRACQSCHHEHRGRAHALIQWGPKGQKGFDHDRTGYVLLWKHLQAQCKDCHEPRRVKDPRIAELLRERPQRKTFLGLPNSCQGCHFDEHRGQVRPACKNCHTERGWRASARYDHAQAAFALKGKHRQVACDKCHPREEDTRTPADAFPGPVSRTYLRFAPIPFESCENCHEDKHEGKLGPNCRACHTEAGWRVLRGGEVNREFHQKVRFPLEGAHQFVDCATCHGPFPGIPARFKGLPFAQCSDCHPDAHLGQLSEKGRTPSCERCHGVVQFLPTTYPVADHGRTRFALEGAHQAVACNRCHAEDERLSVRIDDELRRYFRVRGRKELWSLARFEFDGTLERCDACHRDPHDGQFSQKDHLVACATCHQTASFSLLRFVHSRDSRFRLEGKHQQAACGSCHRALDGTVVRYRPLERSCAGCHLDVHAGQFSAPGAPATDCARCHRATGWKAEQGLFVHQAPFTTFALEGAHAKVQCARCHPEVPVGAGVKVRRYKPLERTCFGCHEDYHRGAFRGFLPDAKQDETRCEACHSPRGFAEVEFPHERTGFRLEGKHQKASCKACHPFDFRRAAPRSCSGCHRDAHAGELGSRCEGCHEALSWKSTFDVDAHRRGGFPLAGRHAAVPCQECHPSARDRSFVRPNPDCIGCHQLDYGRTELSGVSHQALGFGMGCRACHDTASFRGARFIQHDTCFAISRGPHARVACLTCHQTLSGASAGGACVTGTFSCTSCHAHSRLRADPQHQSVPGYEYRDGRCYECHRVPR